MRAMRYVLLLGALGGALLLAAPRSLGGDDDGADPAALYRGRCATCHAIPDPGLRTDRAWLDQVHRTT